MRILCLDIPAPGASLEKYAPHLNAEALHAWGLYKSGFIRDIYFRQDRPGVAIFLECDSVDEAMNVMAEFPLAKAGLLSFECIPLGSFINWENLFADEFKNKWSWSKARSVVVMIQIIPCLPGVAGPKVITQYCRR